MPRLDVRWYDEWHPDLDKALASLPAMESWSHELYIRLVRNPAPARKRIALVNEEDGPLAVAGLRFCGRWWEPVTNWILPCALFPARTGEPWRVLGVLRTRIRVGLWRWDEPPKESTRVRTLASGPCYRASLSGDFERYWQESGHWNTVRRMRNRCRGFRVEVNRVGSAAWTIRNWEAQWRPSGIGEMPDLQDRLLAAEFLERTDQHMTLTLLDGDRLVAGNTFLKHGRDLVWQVAWRDPEYEHHGVGTRLMDAAFHWARDAGFASLDLGGGHDYKRRWAPESGTRREVEIWPGQFKALAGRVASGVRRLLRRAARQDRER